MTRSTNFHFMWAHLDRKILTSRIVIIEVFPLYFQVDEQCGPLNALNRSQVIFALNQTLLQAENVRLGLAKPTFSTDELIRLYRTGELDAFYFKQDALLYPHLRYTECFIGTVKCRQNASK